jgi:hypothetical protein
MNKLAVALAALALSLPAAAQDRAAQDRAAERGRFGLGVSIVPIAGTPTVELYLPIAVSRELRLEPSLGIDTGDDTSNVTTGLGVFVLSRLAPAVDMYVGGRVKLNFASVDVPGGGDESGTDFLLAGALGGEYYLAPRFSLGLEGDLGFHADSDASGDDSGLFTTGLAFLRLYF